MMEGGKGVEYQIQYLYIISQAGLRTCIKSLMVDFVHVVHSSGALGNAYITPTQPRASPRIVDSR